MKYLSVYISLPLLITSLVFTNNLNAAPYAGFSVGQATLEDYCDVVSGIPGVSCDDSDTFLKYLAVQK